MKKHFLLAQWREGKKAAYKIWAQAIYSCEIRPN